MSQYGGLERYEAALVEMGAGMTFPTTPDFASRVFGGMVEETTARRGRLGLNPRYALLALAGVVLAACAAAGAYYISGQNWLSSDPRGVQFSDEFELTRVLQAEQGETVPYLEFAGAGDQLYAVSDPYGPNPAVVRVATEPGSPPAEVVRFAALADPALWPEDADVERGIAPLCCEGRGMLAATPDGEVFVLASLLEESGEQAAGTPAALIVIRPDGSRQRLASLEQLFAESGHDSGTWIGTSIAAAVDGEVWLTSRSLTPEGDAQFTWLLTDPNEDGDWGDVAVRRFELPGLGEPPEPAEENYFPEAKISAIPGQAGELLVHVRRDGTVHEVHRLVADGQFDLLFSTDSGTVATTVMIEPRLLTAGDEETTELVAAGLSAPGRLSTIAGDDEVTDIARAFGAINDIAVGGGGEIYVWAQEVDRPTTLSLYRLRQLEEGEEPAAGATVVGAATPVAAAAIAIPGEPGIVYSRQQFDPAVQQILFQPLGGGQPAQLIPGDHAASFCQSPSGETLAYASDAEVPGELYLHVAGDGEAPRKVTESQVGYWCLNDRYLLLTSDPPVTTPLDAELIYFPGQGVIDPRLHNIESGEERPLPESVDRWLPSRDGGRLLLVTIGEEGESLVSYEVESGETTVLLGPLENSQQFSNLQWSPDGDGVAYVTGPPAYEEREVEPGSYVLHSQDPGGEPEAVYEFERQLFPPTVEWSPSGEWFLAQVNTPVDCPEIVDLEAGSQCDQIELQLIEAGSGEASTVTTFPGYLRSFWAPDRDVFVYAQSDPNFEDGLDEAFFVMEPGRQPRELLRTEPGSGRCPWCEGGFGWSPDGRYYGLAELGGVISVLEIETGELTVLVDEPEDITVTAQWLRSNQEDQP